MLYTRHLRLLPILLLTLLIAACGDNASQGNASGSDESASAAGDGTSSGPGSGITAVPDCGPPESQSLADGKAIFTGKGLCFTCHGQDGSGITAVAPDLTDNAWIHTGGKYDSIVALIHTGIAHPEQFPAPMPPMGGGQLTDKEICAVAAYVHSLSQPPAQPQAQ